MFRDGFLRFCDDPEIACCRAEAELGRLRTENAQLRAELSELQEMAKAKAEGRLVKLPCKVGDTVYFAYPGCRKVDDAKVVGFWVSGEWLQLQLSNGSTFTCWDGPEIYFGKTVFLTREAAEKAIVEVGE